MKCSEYISYYVLIDRLDDPTIIFIISYIKYVKKKSKLNVCHY